MYLHDLQIFCKTIRYTNRCTDLEVRNGLPDLYHGFRSTHDTGIVAWDQDYNNIK